MSRAALEAIVDATDVRDLLIVRPTSSNAQPLELPIPLDPERGRALLATFLYANYYAFDPKLCQQDAVDYLTLLGLRVSDRRFVDAMREAVPGSGYFVDGWQVIEREDHDLRVRKDGVTLTARVEQHLPPDQQSARVGDLVSVRFPRDSVMGAPGFYLAFSNLGPATTSRLTRIYLNLDPEYAVAVTRELLHRLLPLGIPYTYKVLSDPVRYRRRDSAVLYVNRTDLEAAMPQVLAAHDRHSTGFRAPVPSFTRYIRDGVGIADNPTGTSGIDVSFGEHRMGLIADAICKFVASSGKVAFHRPALLAAIEDHLRTTGLLPEKLYLASSDAADAHCIESWLE